MTLTKARGRVRSCLPSVDTCVALLLTSAADFLSYTTDRDLQAEALGDITGGQSHRFRNGNVPSHFRKPIPPPPPSLVRTAPLMPREHTLKNLENIRPAMELDRVNSNTAGRVLAADDRHHGTVVDPLSEDISKITPEISSVTSALSRLSLSDLVQTPMRSLTAPKEDILNVQRPKANIKFALANALRDRGIDKMPTLSLIRILAMGVSYEWDEQTISAYVEIILGKEDGKAVWDTHFEAEIRKNHATELWQSYLTKESKTKSTR
jgi:hypothetical protein